MNKKTIWITGGSTGIGKALAIKFANEGWNVAISARRENLLKEISDSNENIYGFPLDVTDKNNFKMPFLKTTEYAADKIYDGLVNKNVFEIHFPKSLTLILKLFSFLPSKIYFSLVGKMTKYQKNN